MQQETQTMINYLLDLAHENDVPGGYQLEDADSTKLRNCSERLDAQAALIKQQSAEIAILSQQNPNGSRNPSEGDPCGRSCEGQAYRIELRQALDKVEQQAKRIAELERLNLTFAMNEQKLEALRAVLKEADDYLSNDRFNEIGSGSILHRQMQDALTGQ